MEQNTQKNVISENKQEQATSTQAPKKRGRKKKNELPKVPDISMETKPVNRSTPMWFSVASNLAILIAVFTIVFAAHKGLQNSRNTSVAAVEPQVAAEATPEVSTEQTAQTEETANTEATTGATDTTLAANEAVQAEAPKVEAATETPKVETATTEAEAKPETAVAAGATTAEVKTEAVVEAPPAPVVEKTAPVENKTVVTKKKIAPKKNVATSDPYTNGGPLDLDRRDNIVKQASQQMNADAKTTPETKQITETAPAKTAPHDNKTAAQLYTDSNNPWNGKGEDDLDSTKNRDQYKKSFNETTNSAK